MLSVNGIPLDNRGLGWFLRPDSNPFTGVALNALQAEMSGVDGNFPLPSTLAAPSWPLVVNVEPSRLEALNALFTSPRLSITRTGDSSRSIDVRLLSSASSRVFSGAKYVDMTYVVELTGVYWRAGEVTTSAALSAASVPVTVLAASGGLSAPVRDAVVRVKGAVSALQVTDSAGSWFTFPSVAADRWLRFETATGRAFLTSTDTWSGGTEVSGDIDFNGPRGRFEITPYFPSTLDPTAREGRLTVATTTRTSASIQVRARAAHLV